MKHIFVVEDEVNIALVVKAFMEKEGFRCTVSHTAVGLIEQVLDAKPDLIVLDVMLPGGNGVALCQELRQHAGVPIVMLTAKTSEQDRLNGLQAGADDYVTKPFHREELIARIHAIIRRSKGHSQSVIQTGNISVNLDAKTVSVGSKHVSLTGKEYRTLELLSLRKGTTLTNEMFLNHLYGGMDEPEVKIIDVFICKLRKKLAEATEGGNLIETVWGRGYVLRDPQQQQSDLDTIISAA